jgi:hypothetical protein
MAAPRQFTGRRMPSRTPSRPMLGFSCPRRFVGTAAPVLTNESRLPRAGKETWYSLFVSGGSSRVFEAHSHNLILSYPRALAPAAAGARPIAATPPQAPYRELADLPLKGRKKPNGAKRGTKKRKIRSLAGTNPRSLRSSPNLEGDRMQENQPQRLLSYGVDWRALLSWTLIIVAFSLLSLASVVLVP